MLQDKNNLALDLDFGLSNDGLSYQKKARQARRTIKNLLIEGRPGRIAWSSGKLCLGQCPPIIVTHADPGIENPEMVAHARDGIKDIEAYANYLCKGTLYARTGKATQRRVWQ